MPSRSEAGSTPRKGWLASAYNTTTETFAAAWRRLQEQLCQAGKDPDRFPNAIATMFCYVTEDRGTADRIVRDTLSPALNRPEGELRQRLLVGPAQECAEKLMAYREVGAKRVLLWPVADEHQQLELLRERVLGLV